MSIPSPSAHRYEAYVLHDATGYPMLPGGCKQGIIDIATAGDNVLLPAVAGVAYYVFGYVWLAAAASQTVRWKNGASLNLSGPMTPAQFGGAAPVLIPPAYWFETSPGNALVMNLAQSTQVSGHYVYWSGSP